MEVVIIKYNAGNIESVCNALHRLGVQAEVTDDPERIRAADRVIFPGVGEAANTMAYLRARGLDGVIRSLTQPVLGICLGLQLMCAHSEEGDTPAWASSGRLCISSCLPRVANMSTRCPIWGGTPFII